LPFHVRHNGFQFCQCGVALEGVGAKANDADIVFDVSALIIEAINAWAVRAMSVFARLQLDSKNRTALRHDDVICSKVAFDALPFSSSTQCADDYSCPFSVAELEKLMVAKGWDFRIEVTRSEMLHKNQKRGSRCGY
jgi:hypothetical protein